MSPRHSPAPNPGTDVPLRPCAIRLLVQDLTKVSDFYQNILGLDVLDESPAHASLGSGGRALLHLETRPGLIPAGPRAAGLFHAAFLLPDRASLGAWLAHAAEARAPIVGASDHIVSEAIYLSDPEGNGVEIYTDRPPAQWRGPDGAIRMSTGPLDLNALAGAAKRPWQGFPAEGTLGHVHLQVGELAEADRFWQEIMGLELTTRYPGASFYATGGYHHHVAANVWNSRNAPKRGGNLTGLREVGFRARDSETFEALGQRIGAAKITAEISADALVLSDPWNITIRITKE